MTSLSRIAGGSTAIAAFGVICFLGGLSVAREPAPAVAVLMSTGKTVIGQPIDYPTGSPAKVTAAVITMQPGQSTGWHRHDVPLFGYMLEGEITVDYGPKHGKKVYAKGDTLMEAIGEPHYGAATSSGPASILAVFVGADDVKNTENVAAPH
ncbi:MAG: hypothetical protein APF80_05505 [Alphaproteobacteria bacterium BRH_c36]|nr:MAG: hypothetical protein APF80_05505 [Alphaproteobacteria bacterium BRH_c36]